MLFRSSEAGDKPRPVMSLVGSVLSIKALRAGEGASYNYTHIASQDTRIALASGGFGQGVARSLGNHASVEICGALYPIVGRVAMDVCVVDIGGADLARGDEVIYFADAVLWPNGTPRLEGPDQALRSGDAVLLGVGARALLLTHPSRSLSAVVG